MMNHFVGCRANDSSEGEVVGIISNSRFEIVHGGGRLSPTEAAEEDAWLTAHDADSVLVRPDSYVFDTRCAETLLQAWAMSKVARICS